MDENKSGMGWAGLLLFFVVIWILFGSMGNGFGWGGRNVMGNAGCVSNCEVEKQGIIDAAGLHRVSSLSGLSQDRVTELAEYLKANTDQVPNGDPEMEAFDRALASLAVEEAVTRHAGTMEETYTLMGLTYVQSGKNLTNVKQIVVTGGSLIHTSRTAEIASHALFSPLQPTSLRPKQADVWVDRTYILAAMGLLSTHYPQTALRIMKKELEYHGYSE